MKLNLFLFAFCVGVVLACTPKKAVEKTVEAAAKAPVQPVAATTKPGRGAPTRYMIASMERGSCYGKCPSYKLVIWNDGEATYEGLGNVKRMGKFTTKVEGETLKQMTAIGSELGILKMEARYPLAKEQAPADLPVTSVYFNSGEKEHFITDIMGAPSQLTKFEEYLDNIINALDWKETKN